MPIIAEPFKTFTETGAQLYLGIKDTASARTAAAEMYTAFASHFDGQNSLSAVMRTWLFGTFKPPADKEAHARERFSAVFQENSSQERRCWDTMFAIILSTSHSIYETFKALKAETTQLDSINSNVQIRPAARFIKGKNLTPAEMAILPKQNKKVREICAQCAADAFAALGLGPVPANYEDSSTTKPFLITAINGFDPQKPVSAFAAGREMPSDHPEAEFTRVLKIGNREVTFPGQKEGHYDAVRIERVGTHSDYSVSGPARILMQLLKDFPRHAVMMDLTK